MTTQRIPITADQAPHLTEFRTVLTRAAEAEEIVRLAADMLATQRRYFRTRSRDDLVASKQIERAFDVRAADFLAREKTNG